MNFALFSREVRTSFPLLLVFAVLTGGASYAILANQLYDSPLLASLAENGGIPSGSLSFYTAVLIGMLLLFALILSNRLVSHQVSNRRMGYLLASPNSRRSIAATKRFVIVFQMMILTLICSAVFGWLTMTFAPETFDGRALTLASLGAFFLVYALSGLMFLFTCCFRRSLPSVVLSVLLCAVFGVLRLIAAQGGTLAYCRFASPFTLLDLSGILAGDMIALLKLLALFIIGLVLQFIAFAVFQRKNFDYL